MRCDNERLDRRDKTGINARFFIFFTNQDKTLAKTQKKKVKIKPGIPKFQEETTDLKSSDIIATTWKLAEPICSIEGMELVHIEYQREPAGRILRLYIDKPGGVSLGDCSAISAQLGDVLDLKLETGAPYTLEVSSPGLNRPLSKLTDFEKFRGEAAKIKTDRPINGQKNFKGILTGIIGSDIQLQTETETVAIPYQDIIKARLVNYDGDNKCL
jgi:ribosome maturation factor RimP